MTSSSLPTSTVHTSEDIDTNNGNEAEVSNIDDTSARVGGGAPG